VYAPDLPGHGGSVGCPATSMGQIAETIATFCMARGLNRIMLVGHSMGGNIAAELTLRHPDLIERLVLVNPAIQARDMPIYTRSYLHSHQGWLALRASIALAQQVSRFGAHVPHEHGGGLIMPTLRRFRYMAQHDPEVVHRLLGAMFANPLLERLPNITQPTLLIAGQHDPLVPLALSRRVAQAIPGARLAVIPNGAHNPMDEHPAIFSALFLPFLGLR
jgi:pimeloyl-ACP methyl ester carboxylesterase